MRDGHLNTAWGAVRRHPHTTTEDAMAPLVALLARQPSTMLPAMVKGLQTTLGAARTGALLQTMIKINEGGLSAAAIRKGE